MGEGVLVVRPGGSLRGTIRVPGDKSISHRSVLLASLLRQRITIEGFLRSDDCLRTVAACRALGVEVEDDGKTLTVTGRGPDGLAEPADVIDVGNAGTAIRLLTGLLAGQSFYTVVTGDASIRRRPMGRVVEPLRRMGASIWGRSGGNLAPLSILGAPLRGYVHHLPVASAQVKSCLLIAGLFADGSTEVHEPAPTRDHTERMLTALGAPLEWKPGSVRLWEGRVSLQAASTHWRIPGDFSSAAFFLVAALITPDSDLTICDVGVNPTRTGLLDVLWEMGADISVHNRREWNGEPVADLRVRSSRLKAADVGGDMIPRLIDELPVFAVAAAHARGTSRVRDAAELRVKESDRIDGLAAQLEAVGIRIIPAADGFSVPGDQVAAGGVAHSLGDHRIAMSLAVAGLTARAPVAVEEPECINVSFPGFSSVLDAVRRPGEGSSVHV